MSSQLVSYNFCLNSSIDSVSNTLLNISCVFVNCLFHRRWNHETDKKMIRYVPFKNGSFKDREKEFVRIWSIAVVTFCVTLFGLFIIGIIPFP